MLPICSIRLPFHAKTVPRNFSLFGQKLQKPPSTRWAMMSHDLRSTRARGTGWKSDYWKSVSGSLASCSVSKACTCHFNDSHSHVFFENFFGPQNGILKCRDEIHVPPLQPLSPTLLWVDKILARAAWTTDQRSLRHVQQPLQSSGMTCQASWEVHVREVTLQNYRHSKSDSQST